MRFLTILAIPFLIDCAFALPHYAEVLPRDRSSVAQTGVTDAVDQLCLLGKCVNSGHKCNIDRKFPPLYIYDSSSIYTEYPRASRYILTIRTK